jgi:hypothetical protein
MLIKYTELIIIGVFRISLTPGIVVGIRILVVLGIELLIVEILIDYKS